MNNPDSTPFESPRQGGNFDLDAIVRAAVEAADGDLPEAARLIETQAKKNSDLLAAITFPYLTRAIWELVRLHARVEKRIIWQAPNADPKGQNGHRVKHMADDNFRSLMALTLPIEGLPRLGDATRVQLEEAIHFYQSHAKDMQSKSRFLEMVLHALPAKKPNTKVRDCLTETQLEKFREQVKA